MKIIVNSCTCTSKCIMLFCLWEVPLTISTILMFMYVLDVVRCSAYRASCRLPSETFSIQTTTPTSSFHNRRCRCQSSWEMAVHDFSVGSYFFQVLGSSAPGLLNLFSSHFCSVRALDLPVCQPPSGKVICNASTRSA